MTGSRREQWSEETRRAIAGVAVELFAEQGFSATTVAQIAERAGVSERSFFRYFGGKEDPVFDRGEEHLRSLLAIVRDEAPRHADLSWLIDATCKFARRLVEDADLVHTLASIVDKNPQLLPKTLATRLGWEQSMADELLGFGYGKERAVHVLVTAVLAALNAAVREWGSHPDVPLDTLAAEYLESLAPALATVRRARSKDGPRGLRAVSR